MSALCPKLSVSVRSLLVASKAAPHCCAYKLLTPTRGSPRHLAVPSVFPTVETMSPIPFIIYHVSRSMTFVVVIKGFALQNFTPMNTCVVVGQSSTLHQILQPSIRPRLDSHRGVASRGSIHNSLTRHSCAYTPCYAGLWDIKSAYACIKTGRTSPLWTPTVWILVLPPVRVLRLTHLPIPVHVLLSPSGSFGCLPALISLSAFTTLSTRVLGRPHVGLCFWIDTTTVVKCTLYQPWVFLGRNAQMLIYLVVVEGIFAIVLQLALVCGVLVSA
ncbi:hypothetical protein FISHEDRAFT_55659 [Fistulina hepatica ATCC 64428]|uniref:Uncharacterized protein n=1 Tax=Fistulina hepatica ATCC 64428 TaxID=1128425 RepID=A0A0D7ALA6_9AGAR|nr:hypothetical protein FISHEDRAFT_55659 [Fistulina hepatica ATCC 64428]